MSEENEPDWLAELAKGGDAVLGQIEQLVQSARRFMRDGRQAMASSGPVPPLQDRVIRAVGAAARELAPARQPVIQPVLLPTTVIGHSSLTGGGTITATGSLTMAPMRVSGQATVQNPPDISAEQRIGQILAMVLLWLIVLAVPAAVMATDLSPEAQATLDAYDAMLAALAVKITFRIIDKRK
jgi:hypothetical protein